MWKILFFFASIVCGGTTHVSLVQSFVTRPDILAPVLDIRKIDNSIVSSGSIFLTTWEGEAQSAPYIYATNGPHHLSNGTSVLSVFRGHSDSGRGQGHAALLDSSYNLFRTVEIPSSRSALDFHEFNILDDGNMAVAVAFQPYQGDLSHLGIKDTLGWLLDSVFLCIDLESGAVAFEWKASDHISVNESVVWPSLKNGAGLAYNHAFDWFHINSVARFENGDYLLSARHTDTIYRLDRRDGTVVWRLGGPLSSFLMDGVDFSAQHDARIVSESAENGNVVISLYNNGFNGQTRTETVSSAMMVEIDKHAMTARLVREAFAPIPGLAQNTGSLQYLPNKGNFLVSWGQMTDYSGFTEFGKDGQIALDVAFGDPSTRNYRVRKDRWTGRPTEEPEVYLYAQYPGASTHFWISWNGATDVTYWKAYELQPDKEKFLKNLEKDGFETHVNLETFISEGYVEAIGGDGRILGRSKRCKVFIPPATLAESCGEAHCRKQIMHAKERRVEMRPSGETAGRFQWRKEVMQTVILLSIGYAIGRSRGLAGMFVRRRHAVMAEG
ncbi:Hypothetical predicted protein [Lecanosticta acicola]|uniref:ASST-domain-containing protein n=1 Tax=Lecanosticta acicola TaxID=111012 RepID=A0AAI8Z1C7_9PEZI|nr:Hypothetical predicted protein [Lecanosticta acicola]